MMADLLLTSGAVLWVGIADRVRGGFPDDVWFDDAKWRAVKNHIRHVIKFTPGIALAYIAEMTEWWQYLLAAITWKFGEQVAGDFGSTFRHFSKPGTEMLPLIRVGLTWPMLTFVAFLLIGFAQQDAQQAAQMVAPWVILFLAASPAGSLTGGFVAEMSSKWQLPWWCLELHTPPAWQEFLRGIFTAGFLAIIMADT